MWQEEEESWGKNNKNKKCSSAKYLRSTKVWDISESKMRRFVLLLVLLPRMIVGDKDSSTTDNEKYMHDLTPSQSLYCNDLNPQSHLDFNMVIDTRNYSQRWRTVINYAISLTSRLINFDYLDLEEGSVSSEVIKFCCVCLRKIWKSQRISQFSLIR